MKTLLIISSFLILFSCKASPKQDIQDTSQNISIESMAKEKFGETVNFTAEVNSDSTLLLCKTIFKPTPEDPHQSVKFFIYDISGNHIIYDDFIKHGHINWYDRHHLKISYIPEIIQTKSDTKDYIYVVDVLTGKKNNLPDEKKERK